MENELTDGDLAGILLLDPKGHLTGCLVALLIIFVASLPLKYLFYDQKTRWFALHALANFAISTYAVPDILSTINAPEQSMTDAMFSWYPSYISFSIHLYHMLDSTCCSGSSLRLEDLMHHVIFVGIFGAVNFAFEWGPIVNVLLFFITGVPGGITYVSLVCRKEGYISSLTQKNCNKWIDLVVRAPGLVLVAGVMIWNATNDSKHDKRIHVPVSIAVGCAVLAASNGIYYAHQVVRNYARAREDATDISK